MVTLRHTLAVAALIAFPLQAVAATENACLTRVEAKGIGMFILPDTILAFRDKCRGTLAANAYLNQPQSAERFRDESERRWPAARAAFNKMAGGGNILKLIGEEATRKLLIGSVTEGVTKDMKPKSCAGIDQMLAALAPLPPANLDMLLESFFLLGLGSDGKAKSGFRICSEIADVSAPVTGMKR
jgi:hypothetical protein